MARENGPEQMVKQARCRLSDHHTAILEYSKAIDPNTSLAGPTKSVRTVETYTDNLRRFQERAGEPLLELSTDDVRAVVDRMNEELSTQSVAQYQSAIKGFYRYHDGHDVDPDEIAVQTTSEVGINEKEVLTGEEFHALREAADNPRDRCIIDLFGYTGQRIRVIQTLRVRDVDPSDGATGAYWLNTDVDGLKGAEKAMSRRPLLGAKRAVMDWLSYHPTGEPDDYLITVMPSSGRGEPGAMVSQNTLRRAIKGAAERAGIDKPVNPHAFRHFFATSAKRDYDMDDETIRRLLGHGPGSRIMETTYRHLTDDDVITDAEVSFGAEVPEEEESSFTPPSCPTCSEALSPGAKACSRCGAVFTPDAQDVQKSVQQDVGAAKALADGELSDEEIEDIANDDAILAKLIEMRSAK